jgi:hypothetical protein
MTATVTDAVAQLRATTAGLGKSNHSIRCWMGDWMVDSSLESMIPQVAVSTAAQYDISLRQYLGTVRTPVIPRGLTLSSSTCPRRRRFVVVMLAALAA